MARPVGVAVSIASVSEWNFYATGAEIIEHRYQVAQAAAQPVELPNNQRVAVFQLLEATEQGGALRRGSR
jgi:hypothetical protein